MGFTVIDVNIITLKVIQKNKGKISKVEYLGSDESYHHTDNINP